MRTVERRGKRAENFFSAAKQRSKSVSPGASTIRFFRASMFLSSRCEALFTPKVMNGPYIRIEIFIGDNGELLKDICGRRHGVYARKLSDCGAGSNGPIGRRGQRSAPPIALMQWICTWRQQISQASV